MRDRDTEPEKLSQNRPFEPVYFGGGRALYFGGGRAVYFGGGRAVYFGGGRAVYWQGSPGVMTSPQRVGRVGRVWRVWRVLRGRLAWARTAWTRVAACGAVTSSQRCTAALPPRRRLRRTPRGAVTRRSRCCHGIVTMLSRYRHEVITRLSRGCHEVVGGFCTAARLSSAAGPAHGLQ